MRNSPDDSANATAPVMNATLEALRDRGAARFDPVHFRFIEALARRAMNHQGAARHALDERLVRLIETFGERLDQKAAMDRPGASPPQQGPARPAGPLAELVARLQPPGAPSAVRPVVPGAPASTTVAPVPNRLNAVHQQLSRTWSRLSATQRLAQSRSTLPGNAGPLNSRQLVHRALTLMQELSPDCLALFISHVDALMWIEQANESDPPTTARIDGEKKPSRSRTK